MLTQINPEIFRAYDIRGIVGDTLTPEILYAIGVGVGSEAIDRGQHKIIVARDGRLSGPVLMESFINGVNETGCDVIDLGAVPTPLLYFATYMLDSQSGVMLTGSHNPPHYNGLKIVLSGETLSDKAIKDIYHRIQEDRIYKGCAGTRQNCSLVNEYITHVVKNLSLKRSLKIVIDCGNGIAGAVAPSLFRQLGCEVIELFCDVDGNFPHHHPDPSEPKNLQHLIQRVAETQADLGLAFDGDGDRLGVVTNRGAIIWPDRQLMLFAIDVLQANPQATILYDVKCTNQLEQIIKNYNGKPLMWKTGHSLIKAKMRESNALLAGEMSGHIFFNDRWYGFDDALYSAGRLLEILSQRDESCDDIFNTLPNAVNTPELKLTMADDVKFDFIKQLIDCVFFKEGKVSTIDGLRVDFADGWGLIRCSNTTPSLIMRFEAVNIDSLSRIQNLFRQQILALNASLELPF